MKRNWFVVQTKPREEERVIFYLKEKGIESYLPKMEVLTFHSGRMQRTIKPLFPNYVFAHFDAEELLVTVRWTRGVRRILLDSARPTPLRREIVETIRSWEGPDGVIRYRRPFGVEERVRIVRGPFKDLTGIVERWMPDKERVRVLLEVVYQATLELHPSLLEKVA